MNAPTKLAIYAFGLVVIFGGALGLGNALGADDTPETAGPGAHATPSAATGEDGGSASVPGGLQVSQDGYTLMPETTTVKPGEKTDFRFAVAGPDGRPVTAYQIEHEKKLHFIVVGRDLNGFQHLHPELSADGVWSVKLELPSAGTYRAYADFAPAGGSGLTLGVDLHAPGDQTPQPLPKSSRTTTIDGYTVTLAGDLVPGTSSKLTLAVSKDGKPVTDLQPYLGAFGHLVALRAGDLAYLHVHPEESRSAGPEIVFYAEVPSRGDYRLFLDFQHAGAVRTAEFTAHADQTAMTPSAATDHSGH